MNYKINNMTQSERLVEALSILSHVSKDEDRREKFQVILDRLINKMGKVNEAIEENEEIKEEVDDEVE